jgi:hypothetical protein
MKIGLTLLLVGLIIIAYSVIIDYTPLIIGVILVVVGYWKDYYKPIPKTPEEIARKREERQMEKERKISEREQLGFAKKMGYAVEQGRQRAIADAETGMGEYGRTFEQGMTVHFGSRDRYDRRKKNKDR